MNSWILVMNINDASDIASNCSDIFLSASKESRIADVVLFLPSLNDKALSVLNSLAVVSSECCPSVSTHVFIEEEDRYNIPFNHVVVLKRNYPKLSVHSKEDKVKIGDHSFTAFSSEKFTPDELEEYLWGLYQEPIEEEKRCVAVSSSEDADLISGISSHFTCLKAGEVFVFSSRLLPDSYDHIKKNIYCSNEYLKNLKTFELEQLRRAIKPKKQIGTILVTENEVKKEETGPLLVKVNKKSKGKNNA